MVLIQPHRVGLRQQALETAAVAEPLSHERAGVSCSEYRVTAPGTNPIVYPACVARTQNSTSSAPVSKASSNPLIASWTR